jgi:hypothetical protein
LSDALNLSIEVFKLRLSSSRASRIDWWIIGLRWLLLLSVISSVAQFRGAVERGQFASNGINPHLDCRRIQPGGDGVLIFDVGAVAGTGGLIVDTFVAIALIVITGGADSPLFYALFPF